MKKAFLLIFIISLTLSSCRVVNYSSNNVNDSLKSQLQKGSYALLYPNTPEGTALDITEVAHKKFEKSLGSCYQKVPAVYSSYINGYSKPWSPSNLERIKAAAPQVDFVIFITAGYDKNNTSDFYSAPVSENKLIVNAEIQIIEIKTGMVVLSKSLTASSEEQRPEDNRKFKLGSSGNSLVRKAVNKLLERTEKVFKKKDLYCN